MQVFYTMWFLLTCCVVSMGGTWVECLVVPLAATLVYWIVLPKYYTHVDPIKPSAKTLRRMEARQRLECMKADKWKQSIQKIKQERREAIQKGIAKMGKFGYTCYLTLWVFIIFFGLYLLFTYSKAL